MKPRTWREGLEFVIREVAETIIERHRKYGKRPHLRWREHGCIVRMGDKIGRLEQQDKLERKGVRVEHADETKRDGFIDAAGYSIIALMLMSGLWELDDSDVMKGASE